MKVLFASSVVASFFIPSPIFFGSYAATASGKPIIAIVPAAWHSPVHYEEYANQLRLARFDIISQQLPSTGASNLNVQSVAGDASFIIRNQLLLLIDVGKEVLLVMHSYSGGPGAMAASGLSIAERHAAGQTGGIIRLVFIAAFLAGEANH